MAYVYAKLMTVVPREKRDSLVAELWSLKSPPAIKKLSGRINKMFSGHIEKWDQVKERVMLSILHTKFCKYDDFRSWLLATEDKLLVEASPDSFWGAGMVRERILNAVSVCPGWEPPPGTNTLGRLLMRVRGYIRGENSLGLPVLAIGDSQLHDVTLRCIVISWGGATFEVGYNLAKFCTLPDTETLLFHVGTNDIPKWNRKDPRYHEDPVQCKGPVKPNTAAVIFQKFSDGYYDFFKTLAKQYNPFGREKKVRFFASEVLFRHCDQPLESPSFSPGQKHSKAQAAGVGYNKQLREMEKTDNCLRVIGHSGLFRNPNLFSEDGLHLTDAGGQLLRAEFDHALSPYFVRQG
jgi:ribA/ribD-fused uncharacterized protein